MWQGAPPRQGPATGLRRPCRHATLEPGCPARGEMFFGGHHVEIEYMSTAQQPKTADGIGWTDRRVGNALIVAAGIAFLLVCMMLPLVGPAAAYGSGSPGATTAEHFAKNQTAFVTMLLVTLALAAGATASQWMARRRSGNGPLPWAALSLDALCVAMLAAFAAGLFRI